MLKWTKGQFRRFQLPTGDHTCAGGIVAASSGWITYWEGKSKQWMEQRTYEGKREVESRL